MRVLLNRFKANLPSLFFSSDVPCFSARNFQLLQGLDPTQALIDSSKADLESLFFAPGADADSKQQVASKYELENCKF